MQIDKTGSIGKTVYATANTKNLMRISKLEAVHVIFAPFPQSQLEKVTYIPLSK